MSTSLFKMGLSMLLVLQLAWPVLGTCPPGQGYDGSSCAACVGRTWNNANDNSACALWSRTCPSGQMYVDGSATADRTCVATPTPCSVDDPSIATTTNSSIPFATVYTSTAGPGYTRPNSAPVFCFPDGTLAPIGYDNQVVTNFKLGTPTSAPQPGNVFVYTATGDNMQSCVGTTIHPGDHPNSMNGCVVHDGLLAPGETGTVVYMMIPPVSSYVGSTQNGVTSSSAGASSLSMIFLTSSIAKKFPASAVNFSASACPSGTFKSTSGNVACTPHSTTPCAVGSGVTAGSATADRTCAACPSGQFNAANDLSACQPWTSSCPAGQGYTAGSASTDANCTACASGTWNGANDNSACVPWTNTTCPVGTIDTAGDSTKDRECAIVVSALGNLLNASVAGLSGVLLVVVAGGAIIFLCLIVVCYFVCCKKKSTVVYAES